MECTAIVLLPKYEFFTLAQITQYLIIYTPTMKLISRPNLSLRELLHQSGQHILKARAKDKNIFHERLSETSGTSGNYECVVKQPAETVRELEIQWCTF